LWQMFEQERSDRKLPLVSSG